MNPYESPRIIDEPHRSIIDAICAILCSNIFVATVGLMAAVASFAMMLLAESHERYEWSIIFGALSVIAFTSAAFVLET